MCFKTTLNYVFVYWLKGIFVLSKINAFLSLLFLNFFSSSKQYIKYTLFITSFLSSHTLSHLFLSSQLLFQTKHTCFKISTDEFIP